MEGVTSEMASVGAKTCTKCGEEKSVRNFFRKKAHKDGLTSECKVCAQTRNNLYRKNNREKFRVYELRYLEKYPDKALEKKEKRKIRTKKWRLENLEAARKSSRESVARWANKNPEKAREKGRLSKKETSKKLSDGHIRYRLCQNSTLRAKDIPDSLIEVKRLQILIKRFINENRKTTS